MYIYNAKIFTMNGNVINNGYVKIVDGVIAEVKSGLANQQLLTPEDVDCKGLSLYPGFIDAHTHLGLIEDGMGFEGDDANEDSDPVTPHMRTIDGVNPLDTCFKEALTAGITTVGISPGSANPVSGEIIAVKTFGRQIDTMLINSVGIKFALGENPKTSYHEKQTTPVTRMATAAIIRESLFKAKKYSEDINAAEKDCDLDAPEFDMKSQALLSLIRGQSKAYFHCHRADDIFTAIRIAKEFSLKLVIIHATEGYLIADVLGSQDVQAIVGPIICDRSKPELKNLSDKNASELAKNNVNICICTDHPVIPVQYLSMSAAVAVKNGLPYEEALKDITINAAKILGIDSRIGSIEVGKDADFALFNGNPLDISSSSPVMVICGGEVVV